MAVPLIVSVSPSQGRSVGGELVQVVVRDAAPLVGVWFGARPVLPSAREESPEGTVLWLSVPALVIGQLVLRVENLDDHGRPVPGERAEWRWYEVTRPSLVIEGIVAQITRVLLRMLRAQVVESVRLAVAVDFDDEPGDGARLTPLAESPGLTLGAPTFEPNRFYAPVVPVRAVVASSVGPRLVEYAPGLTVDVIYEITGSSQRAVELLNLMAATAAWLNRTRWLTLARDPDDDSAGTIRWELDAEGGMRSSVGGADGVHVFSTQFRIRGVTLDPGAATGPVAAATEETQLAMSVGGEV